MYKFLPVFIGTASGPGLAQGLLEISDNLPYGALLKFDIRDRCDYVGYSFRIKICYVLKNTAYRVHIRRAWGEEEAGGLCTCI